MYCLLVESSDGLVLVDTGFGTKDYTQPTLLMRLFLAALRTPRDLQKTAVRQVERLGYTHRDVYHIVLTHLHLDHAGGLQDFPEALVHLHRNEYEAAQHPRGLLERFYLSEHWAHGPHWRLYERGEVNWFGFEAIRILPGVSPEILLVPLHGHTRGHCGVVVATDSGWLFHCGDAASPLHRAVDLHAHSQGDQPLNIMGDKLARNLIGPHVPRLRALLRDHGDQVEVISSHDAYSFSRHHKAGGTGRGRG